MIRKNHNLKLTHIVAICIVIFFVISASLIIILVNHSMRHESLREAESKARIILDRNLATHMYFSQNLKPKFLEWTAPFRSKDFFEPSWMTSIYANREIHKYFQSINPFGYYVKDASIDARNPENEADDYEKAFIEKFKTDKNLESHSDVHTINGRPYLIVLRRGEIIEGACLQCHSEPGKAPAGLLRKYGADKAFHRKIGDLASVISMRIPLADAYAKASNVSLELSIVLLIGLIVLLSTQFFLYRRFIIAPIGVIRDKALELAGSEEHLGDAISLSDSRELVDLSDAFNKMSMKLRIGRDHLEDQIKKRTLELHSTNEALKIKIDERMRTEEALNKNRMDLIAIIDNLPFLAWMKDHEGRFVAVNQMFARSCGLPSTNDLIGKTDLDIWPKHLAEAYRSDDLEVMRTRQKKAVEEVVHDQGVDKWFETYKAPLFDVNGNVTGTTGFARDITERKRNEETVRKTEARYQALFSRAVDGIVIMSDEGNFFAVNESFARMHGYSKQEMHQMNMKDLDTPESAKHFPERRRRVLAGEALTFEVEHYHKDGHVFPMEVSVNLVTHGEESYLQGFHRDITERNREETEKRDLKERLQRSEKMEALGQLAGGVAHDLNNVLGVVSGYSELLMERIPEGNPIREYAANILKSSGKAAAIIQDLLTLARRGVTVSEVVDFNNVVSNLLATPEFERLKDYHPRVDFKIDLAKDLLRIKGSPVHLEKTVLNLLSNAAEAIVGSGEVGIRTENRYLDKAVRGYDKVEEGDYVVLTVSDTGRGIPSADMDKIFEPFFTKKSMGRSGTGLGLAIVWGAVKDHKGYIDVQSVEGRGTAFTLYFPVTREKMGEAAQKMPIEEYMGHGESVLVVDDVEGQRKVATALLKELGYQVNAVASGEEALKYLKENKADILILDMIMDPGIDGLSTYKRVIGINPRQKAIIVSGFSETDRVKEAQNLGAGAYVKKPYVLEKIGVAVRDELAKK